ncbi:MAG: NYN domain-containing protein [Bacteroidetes bacterium]|nr:NYN domain-containing protein [Bacteroidota bacterium]
MDTTKELRLAVLIDADNVPYSNIKAMLEEMAKYGTLTFKRIYADWTKPTVSGWKMVLLEHAIAPIQQYSYTTGKNSSDSAMIIDAMDILYSQKVDGFCLVSSDSDFTRLATRLREAGMKVFGFGERKTPASFIAACDKFIYIEILSREDTKNETIKSPAKPANKNTAAKTQVAVSAPSILKVDRDLIRLIKASINDIADENGWAFLGDLGNFLIKKQPNFDSRNYGFSKLVSLIKSIGQFEIDERESGKKNIRHVYVKNK